MKKYGVFTIVFLYFCLISTSSFAAIFNQVEDWGNSDGQSSTWSYICQNGVYEAFFKFDLSSLDDASAISSASLGVHMMSNSDTNRTLWNNDSMIGNIQVKTNSDYTFYTIPIDVAMLNWLGEDFITLKLTGPADGSHWCGEVQLMESGKLASLDINTTPTPVPAAIWLFGAGLASIFGLRRKKASR